MYLPHAVRQLCPILGYFRPHSLTSNASTSASAVAAFAAPSWADLIPITKMLPTPSMPLRTHTNL